MALGFSTGAFATPGDESAPIALHDGLVWTDVRCGTRTLHFVVDTGAASSCIDLAAAKRAGLRPGAAIDVAGVGGRTTGYRCDGFEGRAGGMAAPRDLVALDLSGPSRGCSERIDGLIGADFFRGRVTRIDYGRRILMRAGAGDCRGGVAMRVENGVMCVPVAVDGGPALWTRLDTGCTAALYWCPGARGTALARGKSVALAWFTGGTATASVRIGTTEIRNVPVKVRAGAIFPGEAGLLGNGTLSRYRMTIDGVRDRLLLEGGSSS